MMALDDLTAIPDSLMQFLSDKSITFVGPKNISHKSTLYVSESRSKIKLECNRIVDICYLGAKILMKPKLLTGTLEDLMVEAGLDHIKRPIINNGEMRANWQSSSVLSEEEVKYAMYEVYSCYQLASKLCDVNSRFKAASSHSFDTIVKVTAAYVLAVLGGNTSPCANDLKDILPCVGAEGDDDDRIELLLSQVKSKAITELIAAAREKLAISVPAGGGTIATAAPAGGASAESKEEKVEESDEDMGFVKLFDLWT
ncbi:uncharacterized protein LOC107830599 [Nicotiana tabacum]|uniref:Uncharacterized protein LOC107830599 n=1 Tax=Nicotiana tabacum TaxID=4097 RepID=A0A1S4DKA2_TOBAC|nr:PREDICTED: uncharacterized protein LOC107830599 [Nicotiana tabacum]